MTDDSWPLYLPICILVLIMIINALVVASKRALDYIDRNIIKDRLEDEPDNSSLKAVTEFISKPSKYHYADHIASFFNILVAFVMFNAAIAQQVVSIPALIAANAGFYIIYTAVSDIFPKKIAAQSSEETGIKLIGFQQLIYIITLPVVWICRGIADVLLKLFGKKTDVDDTYFSEDKVMSMLDRGQESGDIKEEGRKMIDSIFEFDDLLAYEIMTPRTDVFMIDLDDDRSEYFDELMELTHSRIPVYQGDPDNIVGILHIKDYLYNATKKGFENIKLKKLLRPAYFVPETKNIDALFRELQMNRHHLAMLIDEYGGFSGIVTVEDIIEQIVGDIDDEFDEEDRIIEQVDDNTYIVDGNVYLDDLEEETGVELKSDTSETIGGLIIENIGEIPDDGYVNIKTEVSGYKFTILSVKEKRIKTLKMETPEEEKDG